MKQAVMNKKNNKRTNNSILIKVNTRKQIVGIIYFCFSCIFFLFFFYQTIVWVKNIYCLSSFRWVVTGKIFYTSYYDLYTIIASIKSMKGFSKINVHEIEKRIGCISWIKKVNVKIHCANRVYIFLVEYYPIVKWNGIFLLDKSGNLFSVPKNKLEIKDIPDLFGPFGKEKHVLSTYLKVNKILKKNKFEIKKFKVSKYNSLDIFLKNGIQVKLGKKNRTNRLKRFVRVYPILIEKFNENGKYIRCIDLRYDVGMAVS